MKIVFMGTPSYATQIFQKLIECDYEIVGLFTQPDKPVGRKQVLTPPHIKEYCLSNHIDIPIFQPMKLRDEECYAVLKNLNPDLIIVAAYGQILPKNILDIAPCINLHASVLPKYRGASPIQESILSNDKLSGVTAMLMDEGLDSGEILGIRYIKIDDDNVSGLFDRLSFCAAELTVEVLNNFIKLVPLKQNLAQVSYCKKIRKEFGLVEFNDALQVYLKSKAYAVWPGIYLSSGLKLIKINLVNENQKNNYGEILDIGQNFIDIGCSSGVIRIFIVQPESKQQMNVVDYIRGKRLKIGDSLS